MEEIGSVFLIVAGISVSIFLIAAFIDWICEKKIGQKNTVKKYMSFHTFMKDNPTSIEEVNKEIGELLINPASGFGNPNKEFAKATYVMSEEIISLKLEIEKLKQGKEE